MVGTSKFAKIIVLSIVLLTANSGFSQNELRNTFFKDADAAKAAAESVDAKLFAPRSYERGMKEYRTAESALERGRNIEVVRSNAADATTLFRTAAKAASLAHTALAQVIKSRQDAANARAPELSPEIWRSAQRKFGDSIRLLESGNLKGAKRREIEATSLYRDAELVAIKAQYLTETRRLLADADRARVGRYAPVTLGKAKRLLANAERELSENRYDTDLPRSLAKQANYEAKHAIYLSEVVRQVRDKKLTAEQLVLQWEQPLQMIAAVADAIPAMESGPDRLTDELVVHFQSQVDQLQALQQEKTENEVRLADMEEEMRTLDERLGGATEERAALVQRLEAQARVKQQFAQVEKLFSSIEARVFREGDSVILRLVGLNFDSGASQIKPENFDLLAKVEKAIDIFPRSELTIEARVFREGDSVILRLVGLNFDSGASQIKPENFDLLAKVEKAIDIFPRSELTIEGHTDSHGGDDSNQKLSQQRAESVQQYMINAMRIPTYRLIATGYGETRPVASNETAAGRARNRRIDIVIKPNNEAN